MNIHIITVLNVGGDDVTAHKVAGWKRYLTMAADFVEHNVADIHDAFFEYAVVEEVEEGLFPVTEKEYWFKWKDGKYVTCAKPAEIESLKEFWRL